MDIEADYGEGTPEHFDRFGVRHFVRYTVNGRARDFVDTNPTSPITRFKLTLKSWWRGWPGMQTFRLDLDGRPMEIRLYSDGRVKIILDDDTIYAETNKVVTKHGKSHRVISKWYDPAVDAEERKRSFEEAREARLAAVREMLEKRRAGD